LSARGFNWTIEMMRKITAAIGFATILVVTSAGGVESALAQVNVETAPQEMSLQIANDAPGEQCRRLDQLDPTSLIRVTLHRTFHDDFDTHPLSSGLWVPHYAGGAAWPEAQYWGGNGSDAKRKDAWNGEQQIYVDPKYQGRGTVALGLDPFKVRNGVLSIMASRIPVSLKGVLFNNEYVSGILTTQGSFAQKYGYFEIRSKLPVGTGVWPAFWMLADNGGWPPEIDILEGRGKQRGDLVMTTHWRIPSGVVQHCGFDFLLPDAATAFHDYGALWLRDRLVYFIDRRPVADIKVPDDFSDPMYMIVNLAMGAKYFDGVGFVDGESPDVVEFEIDRISAYQIDSY
jgi:beta-glucanase (GH16 family)